MTALWIREAPPPKKFYQGQEVLLGTCKKEQGLCHITPASGVWNDGITHNGQLIGGMTFGIEVSEQEVSQG